LHAKHAVLAIQHEDDEHVLTISPVMKYNSNNIRSSLNNNNDISNDVVHFSPHKSIHNSSRLNMPITITSPEFKYVARSLLKTTGERSLLKTTGGGTSTITRRQHEDEGKSPHDN